MKELHVLNAGFWANASGLIAITVMLGPALGTPASLNAATATFQQGVNGYTGTADTHVRQDQPDTAQNGVIVHVDNDNPVSHGLILFTNIFGSGPGQIPTGYCSATVESATLTLRTTNSGAQCNGYRMLVPWDENATWNSVNAGLSPDDVEMLSAPDFSITPSVVGGLVTVDVTAAVRGWHSGALTNYGWGIVMTNADGWQFDSSEALGITNRPLLTVSLSLPCCPVVIVSQPVGQTVNEGGSVSFTVSTAGVDPVVQWLKDGVAIEGATNWVYTIPLVRRTDAGLYRVRATNPCMSGFVESGHALLHVIEDRTPPTVLCAYGSNDNATVFVYFSERVTNANVAVNYAIQPVNGGDNLTVLGATYPDGFNSGSTVILTLDTTDGSSMQPGVSYELFVSAVADLFENVIDLTRATPIARFETAPIIRFDSEWKYDQSGADLGIAWRATNYNDSAWPQGSGVFGTETGHYPASLGWPIRTEVTPPAGGGPVTTYYRTHFMFSGNPTGAMMAVRTIVDDGVVIYLNGRELWRFGVPFNQTYTYLAVDHEGDHIDPVVYRCSDSLVEGDNVLAVEVHQGSTSSPDVLMGLEASLVLPNQEPVALTRQPTGGILFVEGNPFTFSVQVSGTSPRYQWFRNNVAIPGATNDTYSISAVSCPHVGQYQVAVSNDFPSFTISSTVTLEVSDCPPSPPQIEILRTGGMVTLTWSGPEGSVLEAAPSLSGLWSSNGINQARSQIFVADEMMRFFRVREP